MKGARGRDHRRHGYNSCVVLEVYRWKKRGWGECMPIYSLRGFWVLASEDSEGIVEKRGGVRDIIIVRLVPIVRLVLGVRTAGYVALLQRASKPATDF